MMDENKDIVGYDWNQLTTNKTFDEDIVNYESDKVDGSISSKSRESVGGMSLSQSTKEAISQPHTNIIDRIGSPKATTPISLLVQSLIQQLCSLLENDLQKSSSLYERICEKLYQMNLIDNSYQMSEFETMRSQYQRALYQLVSVSKEEDLPIQLDNVWPLSTMSLTNGLEWSRYYREFDELEFIADGGFGQVWKVRHRLDGITYAVKKIVLKSTTIKSVLTHLTEVKTLASLNHVNIVPYKSCWLEPLLSNYKREEKILQCTSATTISSNINSIMERSEQKDSLFLPIKSNESSFNVEFEYSQTQEEIKSSVSSVRMLQVLEEKAHIKLNWATLFIQMKLCEKTLRQFLDERNSSSSFKEFYHRQGLGEHLQVCKEIFQQLVHGLAYIHSRDIVHHDIKPSNIFISNENENFQIQLGDFGLSCPLHSNNGQHSDNAGGIGTPLYAAKEQLEGRCEKKSDTYSLGVILMELCLSCSTEMERHQMVENIRKGIFPDGLDERFGTLIKRLLTYSLKKRPDVIQLQVQIDEILKNSNENNEMIILRRQLSDKDIEIEKQLEQLNLKDDQLSMKEAEIKELKDEITKLKKNKMKNKR